MGLERIVQKIKLKLARVHSRKIAVVALLVLIVTFSLYASGLWRVREAQAAVMELTTTDSTVQIDVRHRYRVIMNTGDTDDYIIIYDRAEDDSSPDQVFEFLGPWIQEGGTDYTLRDDANRTTTVVEFSRVRVVVKVEGKYAEEGGSNYLDDEGADNYLTVSETYTFDRNGFYVDTETDFQDDGLDLDNGDNDDGYRWTSVEFDGESSGQEHLETIYYGDGSTESSANSDGALTNSQTYVVVQGDGTYQDALIGVGQTGWLDVQDGDTTNDRSWYYDVDNSGDTDRLWARQQNTRPGGSRNAQWFMRLYDQDDLDAEAEREAIINAQRTPDTLVDGLVAGSTYKHYIQTKTFQPGASEGKDTYVYYSDTETERNGYNNGAGTGMNVNEQGSSKKSLLEIDLSSIPAEAGCSGAVLSLWSNMSNRTRDISIYEIATDNSDWPEGDEDFATGGAGDSCWNYKDQTSGSETSWGGSAGLSTSGGDKSISGVDYVSSSIGSIVYPDSSSNAEAQSSLDVGAVETWFGGSNTNYGVVMFSDVGEYDTVSWHTSDNTTSDLYFPKLTVDYTNTYSTTQGSYGIDITDTRQGIDFDGSDDYIQVADHTDLDISGNITVEAWVKLDNIDNEQHIVAHNDYSNNEGYALTFESYSTYGFGFRVFDGADMYRAVVGTDPEVGRWYHVAGVYDGSNVRIFVDGVEGSNPAGFSGSIQACDDPLRIGLRAYSTNGDLDGKVDEVRISDTARYSSNFTPSLEKFTSDSDTVALWHLDEGSGTDAYDETTNCGGSGCDGTLTGDGLTWMADFERPNSAEFDIDGGTNEVKDPSFKVRGYRRNTLPKSLTLEDNPHEEEIDYNIDYQPISSAYFADELLWHSTLEDETASESPDIGTGDSSGYNGGDFELGKYGQGFESDGSGEYVYFPMSSNVNSTTGTVEFWYKETTNASGYEAFFGSDEGDNEFQLVRNNSDTRLTFGINSSTYSDWNPVSINVFDGSWHHIRLTYDTGNNSTYLYIDGVSQGEDTTDHGSVDLTSYNLRIGYGGAGNPVDGIIDEFRVYDTVLGPEPISAGGNTNDSSEYLANAGNDYTLDFEADDSDNRGEYAFFGSPDKFTGLNVDLETVGVGGTDPDLAWEYWDGDSWADLESVSNFTDDTSDLTSDGTIYWDEPSAWSLYSVNGSTDLYYVRAHLESGDYTTDPVENKIYPDIFNLHLFKTVSADDQTIFIPGWGSMSDPVGYWNFNDDYGTTANDHSGYSHNGTITDAAWTEKSRCVSGKCLHFDGDGDNVSVPDSHDLDVFENYSLTVQAWFRHAPTSSTQVLLAKHETSGSDGGYKLLMESDGDITFGIDDDNSSFPEDAATSTSADYDDNEWHLATGVYDADSGTVTLFIDGNQVAQDTSIAASNSKANDDSLYIGIDGDGASNDWDGFIDEVKVYKYARSTAEIKADFAAGGTVRGASASFGSDDGWLSDGLIGYWKMDDFSGTTVTDYSGNGYDGTATDAATGNGDGDTPPSVTASGRFSRARSFDGTDDFVDLGSNDLVDGDDERTITAWFNADAFASDCSDAIISNSYSATAGRNFQICAEDNAVAVEFWSHRVITPKSTLSTGEWYQVAVVVPPETSLTSDVQVFIDGEKQLLTDEVGSAQTLDTNWPHMDIGRLGNYNSSYFDGSIDEVRVYDRALSPGEVEKLYKWGPGPIAYYKFDEGDGQTAYDLSGNDYHATLYNDTHYVQGKYGSAVSFDGTDYGRVSDISSGEPLYSTGEEHRTISAWVYVPSGYSKRYGRVFRHHYDSDADDIEIAFDLADGEASFRYGDQVVDAPASSYSLDSWFYVTGVYNGSTMKIYIDGVLAGSDTETVTSTMSTNSYLELGAELRGDYNALDGHVDELIFYDYARTREQVIEDMNAGHPLGGSPVGSQLAYWKFDEGYETTAYDSSMNDKDLTLSTASWGLAGKYGRAYDGADNTRASRSDDDDLDFTAAEAFTVSGWFKRDTISNDEYIVYKADGNEGYTVYLDSTGDVIFGIGDTNSTGFPEETIGNLGSDYDDNVWHHFAAVKNGTSYIRLYVDGNQIASDGSLAVDATLENAGTFYVGDANGSDGSDEFLGDIDELKVYAAALTADQVRAEYNQGKAQVFGAASTDSSGDPSWSAAREYCIPGDTSTCDPPVGHWRLDEGTGTTSAYDTAGSLTGTFASMSEDLWRAGKYGRAVNFDGSVRLDTGTNYGLQNSSFTVGGWMKRNSTGGVEPLLANTGTLSDEALWLEYDASDHLKLDFFSNDLTTTDTYTNLGWHHIFATYDVSTNDRRIYRDGKLVAQDTSSADMSGSGTFYIGYRHSGAVYSDAVIDDVKFYDYARTPAQIVWDYNRGAPVTWWKLDECSGTTANDWAPAADGGFNGHDGTITIGTSGDNSSAGSCDSGNSNEAWNNGSDGKYNASLDLDGNDDYVKYDVTDSTGDMSVLLWTKMGSTGQAEWSGIFSSSDNGSLDNSFQIDLDGSNNYRLEEGSSNQLSFGSASTSKFTHLAVTIDSSNGLKMYLDGEQVNSDATETSGVMNVYKVGANRGDSLYYDGQVDDVRIYNYALTQKQIEEVYNTGTVRFGE